MRVCVSGHWDGGGGDAHILGQGLTNHLPIWEGNHKTLLS